MKTHTRKQEEGSVLMIAVLTITVLTLICAVSLNVVSQNGTATTQTTSWQQSLAGAEAAVDLGMNALNTGTWTGWYTVVGSPGNTKPSGGTQAVSAPVAGTYNYYVPASLALTGEASNAVSMWTTVDTAGLPKDSNGLQGYRIRGSGVVAAPGPVRVSNNKLDNDLRQIALKFDRFSGQAVTAPQAVRRVEVIATPVAQSIWTRGITMANAISMSGGGVIDSFNSSSILYSTNGLYDPLKRRSNAGVATLNSTGSDLRNTYIYGSVQYSGPAIKNTKNVQGTVSSPFNATLPVTVDPVAQSNGAKPWYDNTKDAVQAQPNFVGGGSQNYTSVSSGSISSMSGFVASGTASNPTFIKVSGDFTVPGGKTFALTQPVGSTTDTYITVWVTGKFTVSGSGLINQDPKVHVVWVIDKDITTSGDSYNNQSGKAGYVSFIGVGSGKVTISGSSNFIGTVNTPGYDVTISGSGSLCGAVIGNTLTISGSAGLHYDEALAGNGGGITQANYTFASWFEDNSDPARGVTY